MTPEAVKAAMEAGRKVWAKPEGINHPFATLPDGTRFRSPVFSRVIGDNTDLSGIVSTAEMDIGMSSCGIMWFTEPYQYDAEYVCMAFGLVPAETIELA